MELVTDIVGTLGGWVWNVVFAVLIGVGLYLTARTGVVQLRLVPEMFRALGDKPGPAADGKKGIPAFRAFTVSAASRVGTGNIAGVAVAISPVGPGAVLWMWAIAGLAAVIVVGGIRRISAVSEVVVPVMAVVCIVLGLLVAVQDIGQVPAVLGQILQGVFGVREFVTGGLIGVIVHGMKRGLFSNEAGMGSAPTAGATASVSHPAKQGFLQALGVYFDTWLICSITAFIVLLSNPGFGGREGASLTQSAPALQLGNWAVDFLTVAIFLFAFTSVIGNYYYGESNIRFLTGSRAAMTGSRLLVPVFVFAGAVPALDLVRSLAGLFMGFMATIDLVAPVLLAGVAVRVPRNYEDQRRQGLEPVFPSGDVPGPSGLDAWDGADVVTTRAYWEERVPERTR